MNVPHKIPFKKNPMFFSLYSTLYFQLCIQTAYLAFLLCSVIGILNARGPKTKS